MANVKADSDSPWLMVGFDPSAVYGNRDAIKPRVSVIPVDSLIDLDECTLRSLRAPRICWWLA